MNDNPMYSAKEFSEYVTERYALDRTSSRLVDNILRYIDELGFVDQQDNHRHLSELLYGAFGIKKYEIKMCHFG